MNYYVIKHVFYIGTIRYTGQPALNMGLSSIDITAATTASRAAVDPVPGSPRNDSSAWIPGEGLCNISNEVLEYTIFNGGAY